MAVDTSYLTTQVNNIVEQLHDVFDQIGVPAHERETREAEVFTLRKGFNIDIQRLMIPPSYSVPSQRL